MTSPRVRCRYSACTVPGASAPYDTVHLRTYYPADFTGDDAQRLTGNIPADTTLAPWPVVIVLPGINVPPEGYRWLAERLADDGYATVLYTWVGEITPGSGASNIGITPGIDLGALGPSTYGTAPSATAIAAVVTALRSSDLPLDLDRIVLLGHSAGGTIALENANPAWFPGVRAAISYASHTVPAGPLGHPHGTVLAINPAVPVLIAAGTDDGVISRSADRYGAAPGAADHDPVARTFNEAISRQADDCWLVILDGGTHVAINHPHDTTTARGFLDPDVDDATATAVRHCFGEMVSAFLHQVLHGDDSRIAKLVDMPPVARWSRR